MLFILSKTIGSLLVPTNLLIALGLLLGRPVVLHAPRKDWRMDYGSERSIPPSFDDLAILAAI